MKKMKPTFENWVSWVKMGLTSGLISPSNIKMTIRDVITEVEEETLSSTLVKELTEPEKAIILYNDDVNSFEHVINCLVKYCGHHPHQGEQIATIVHHVGKCAAKGGTFDKLKPICEALLENGLSAKIE